MTVEELREFLSKMPAQYPVKIPNNSGILTDLKESHVQLGIYDTESSASQLDRKELSTDQNYSGAVIISIKDAKDLR